MKKSVIGFLCLILVMSCNFEFPEKINIKGNPGVYLNIGSPFSGLGPGEKPVDYISEEKIMKMMDGMDMGGINIIKYTPSNPGPNDPLTFLVHYPIPIPDMSIPGYDLTGYIDGIFEDEELVPPIVIPDIIDDLFANALLQPGTYNLTEAALLIMEDMMLLTPIELPGKVEELKTALNTPSPLFSISLADMADMADTIVEIIGTFGIELDYNPAFETNLKLKMPVFGMEYYTPGEIDDLNNKLRFVGNIFDLDKLENNNLEVFVQISGGCSGTLSLSPVFEWTSVTVDLSGIDETKMSGNYKIDNILGEFLGGVKFKTVEAYIYINGLGEDEDTEATISLKNNGTYLTTSNEETLSNATRPTFIDNSFTGNLPSDSIGGPINLTDLLNDGGKLEYTISIDELTIYRADITEGKTLTVDLVIKLPLEFEVSTPSSIGGYEDYVKLDLGGLLDDFNFEIDLESGDFAEITDMINTVNIFVEKTRNTFIDGISVLLYQKDENNNLVFDEIITFKNGEDDDAKIKFKGEDGKLLMSKLKPKFEILLPKDGPSGATLRINRQNNPQFDFDLAIQVKTDLDITIDL